MSTAPAVKALAGSGQLRQQLQLLGMLCLSGPLDALTIRKKVNIRIQKLWRPNAMPAAALYVSHKGDGGCGTLPHAVLKDSVAGLQKSKKI
jgi:hypothetical protein